MRWSDFGLVLLIVALAIPVWMLTGAETAMWMGIAIAPFLVVGLVLGLMMAGVRRLRRRRPEHELEEEDEFDFEDIEDAVEVSPDEPTMRMPARQKTPAPVPQVSSQHTPLRAVTPLASTPLGSNQLGSTLGSLPPSQLPSTPQLTAPQLSTPQPTSASRVTPPPVRVTPPPAMATPSEPLPAKVTGPAFVGTTPWGAAIVPTADGGRVIVLVLPVQDASVYEQAPPFPEGMVRAVIVAGWQERGAMAGTRVARLAGLDHVYGVTDTIDRDVEV
jgi:hypothetical protein